MNRLPCYSGRTVTPSAAGSGNRIGCLSERRQFNMAGKGDSYRPVNQKKWESNWDLAFGKKKGNKNGKRTTRKTGERGRGSRKD